VAGSWSFRNTVAYKTAAMMPPATGPMIQTYQFAQSPRTRAGPNHLAGFMAAPV